MDYDRIAAELVRALRGGRSQEAFARRLGCRANAVYTWEAARNFPTAARTLKAAERAGVDVRASLLKFYAQPPAWLTASKRVATAGTVASLLDDLRGKTSIVALAQATERSRFAVARWLKGTAEPRLPDFLRLIEASSLRLIDFIACLVDPEQLPSLRDAYRDLEATRRAAYDAPFSHAFLHALELEAYRALPAHVAGWLSAALQLPREQEDASLQLLVRSGQVVWNGARYEPARVMTVDTRRDREAARRLRLFWSRMAIDRVEQASAEREASSAYNVFGVSHADLRRIRELQRAYFREMRAIIAQSRPVETIALATFQLVELSDAGGLNAG
jgi:transcriptional regulator with XRE-family HTH domain